MTSTTDNSPTLTDEALIKLTINGDTNAETCLIERYRNNVKITAAAYTANYIAKQSLSSIEFDDLFQEGLTGLMSAIYSFQEDKNTSFRTYAEKCISNRILSVLKSCTRKKNTPPGGVVSLEDIEIPSTFSPEDKVISDEQTEDIYSFLNNELSSLENSVIRLYLAGESYGKIALNLGITEKSVDNAVQRVRSKLRGFLNK